MTLYKYFIRMHIRSDKVCACAILSKYYITKAAEHPTARIIGQANMKVIIIPTKRIFSNHSNIRCLFLVIGDEILKAQVKDTNSYYMCNQLYKCGIRVKKVSNNDI